MRWVDTDGVRISLIAGTAFGMTSPVKAASETFYAAVEMSANASLAIPVDIDERVVYVVSGAVRLGRAVMAAGTMAVLRGGAGAEIAAVSNTRLMLLGGAALPGDRHLVWNFVSSRRERIEVAKQDWRAGRFPPVRGDDEFIPLPESA